jgi:hypothetical protein
MNLRELVDHIHSGPTDLVLDGPLLFRRRTRSNPCDFNEFLQALQSSETIISVDCWTHQQLSISEAQWSLLVKTLGCIKGIQRLSLACMAGSRDFRPFQGFADAVEMAQVHQSLHTLRFDVNDNHDGWLGFPRDLSGIAALAEALGKEHKSLEKFVWTDLVCQVGLRDEGCAALDPLLQALSTSACPKLRTVCLMTASASANAYCTLLEQLHLGPAKNQWLVLGVPRTDIWLAVAEAIRVNRCNVQRLTMTMAVAIDHDEVSLAFANALRTNTCLRYLTLSYSGLSVRANEAFSTMLRENTNVVVNIERGTLQPGDPTFDSFQQVRIEQLLNQVGRGGLLSLSQTSTEWVDALNELNLLSKCTCPCSPCICHNTPAFHVSCMYSLLRMYPSALFGEGSDINRVGGCPE